MAPIVIEAKPLLTEGNMSVWYLANIPIDVYRGAMKDNAAHAMVAARSYTKGLPFRTSINDHNHYSQWMAAVGHEQLISSSMAVTTPIAPHKWEVGDRVWWNGSKWMGRTHPCASDQWITITKVFFGAYHVRNDVGEHWSTMHRSEFLLDAPPGYVRRAGIEMAAKARYAESPRSKMTTEQWGINRDTYGVCSVCKADDSMWCDQVVHLSHAHGATLIPIIDFPITNHVIPSHRLNEFSLAACAGELINRRNVSPAARAAWSAELRLLVKASNERERNRILVDRYFEDWE